MVKIKKCFDGAASARKLHLCDMVNCLLIFLVTFFKMIYVYTEYNITYIFFNLLPLIFSFFFPINHLDHWFLFVVDIKDRMLVFLDSLHHKSDPYFDPIIPMMVRLNICYLLQTFTSIFWYLCYAFYYAYL